jgi:hypothetical protein
MSGRELAVYALLAAGSVITLGFMVYAGRPSSLGWFVQIAPFAIWAFAPFAGGALACRSVRCSPRAVAIVAAAAGLLTFGTALLLYRSFVVAPDAQSGLLFLFLPLWQALALAPFILFAVRSARTSAKSPPVPPGFPGR